MIATRLVVLLLLDAITSVLAWGDLGHRTVAYLAQHHLTDEAALMIADVLKNEKGYDISDGAVWADRIRRQHEDSAQWHFIGM